MNVEIITIGEEILIGQIVDTNSSWIGQKLTSYGLAIKKITSVADSKSDIIHALNNAKEIADIIIITGGLGPTNDDITKKTLAAYFNSELIFNEQVFKDLEIFISYRGKGISETNRTQAEIPDNCTPIRNIHGTAPGMWFEEYGKIFISLPGVPYEMKAMIDNFVIPKLQNKFNLDKAVIQTLSVIGIAEADLADMLKDFENKLPGAISLAYLPSIGFVRLRLTLKVRNGKNFELFDNSISFLKKLLKQYIFTTEGKTLSEIIGEMLKKINKTVSTAESCTGGNIAHHITSIPGSSEYFTGSVIAYSNEIKEKILKVNKQSIEKYGAVSQQVVEQMAKGVKELYKTDYSIATSGIAGPSGGTGEKPVGTTWIAVATDNGVFSQKYHLGENRERNIEKATLYGLNMLRLELEKP